MSYKIARINQCDDLRAICEQMRGLHTLIKSHKSTNLEAQHAVLASASAGLFIRFAL